MIVLITGATGFLGSKTVEQFVELDWVTGVVATGRSMRESRRVVSPKVEYKLGDLSSPEFVEGIVKGVDLVINTAALSSPWGTKEQYQRANVLTQKNLIDASIKHGVKRFVFISTPGLYHNGNDRFLVNEGEPLPVKFVNQYAATKREAEVLLEESELSFVSLRPRAIIGAGDTTIMPRLIKAQEEGKLKVVGDGENILDLTSVENVVLATILASRVKEEVTGRAYNITNGEPVKLWWAINTVLDGLGKERVSNRVSYRLAYFGGAVMEVISKWLTKKEPAITRYSIDVLAKNFTLDISDARKNLEYSPKMTTQESIDQFVDWYSEEAD
jgi:nucleoside-diphosphate-sugar epimerase